MDCEHLKSILPDYLDDETTAELCREVEAHMLRCGPCEVEIDEIRQAILIYRRDCEAAKLSEPGRRRLFAALTIEYRRTRTNSTE